ncbi:MAG TPA: IS630 family transposase [Candidatus Nanoarchaeia archaeon]|nr:IS630 family transposase [Candidatus Nanoarchaeia archaeon]
MIPKDSEFLPTVTEHDLRVLVRQEKLLKPQLRLLAALRRKQGWKLEEIAKSMEQPLMTVHNWIRRLHENGLAGLNDKKQPGRPHQLTVKQRREIVKFLERGPPYNKHGLWTTKEVQELLRKKYGVSFVHQHVWRMLDKLGFSMQRPRKKHYLRASEDEIAQFKKKRGEWCSATAGRDS